MFVKGGDLFGHVTLHFKKQVFAQNADARNRHRKRVIRWEPFL
jgi:hypothetical protein